MPSPRLDFLPTALLAVLVQATNYQFALVPVLLNSIVLVAAAVVYNNLTGRRYPHTQRSGSAQSATAARFSATDLDAALAAEVDWVALSFVQRPEDIAPLAAHFLLDIATKLRRKVPRLSMAQLKRLRAYDWPGNVRELRNVLERSVILAQEPDFSGILPVSAEMPSMGVPREPTQHDEGYITAAEFLTFERNNLIAALEAANWRVSGSGGAAELLGMNPSTLASRLKALEITRPETQSLYVRLGGRARIAGLAHDLPGRMQADQQVGRFWRQRSTAGIRQEEKLLVAFLCSALGGPSRYEGRDMLAVHANLDINSSDWSVFIQHLNHTLDALAVGSGLRVELRHAVDGLRDFIVAKKR